MIRLFLASLLMVTAVANADVEYLMSEETRSQNMPFSDAVRVGNVLYLSGQLGVDWKSFKLIEGGIVPETHKLFENIKRTLTDNGSSLDKVFKCTVMMEDIGEWPKFNEIYVTYFPGNKPARSAFGANGLALGAAVEMECWATVD